MDRAEETAGASGGPDTPVVRSVSGDEVDACFEVVAKVFGSHQADPSHIEAERLILDTDRLVGAFDRDGSVVGTAASYEFELSMPGGLPMRAAGVTNVGVLATHRRRGTLRALMAHQFDSFAGEGVPAAILDASEAGIYGRFGYGMASRYAVWEIHCKDSAFAANAPGRRIRFVRQSEAAGVLAPIYADAHLSRPGEVTRTTGWWDLLLGSTTVWKGGGRFFVAVVDPDPDQGEPGGYVVYSVRPGGEDDRFEVRVRELVSASAETAAALWRFCLDVDLATLVRAEVAVDDPLLWRLADPRAARTTQVRDYLFVRLLDVEAAFASRRWISPVDLVVEVSDPFLPGVGGRYRIAGDLGSSTCARTEDDAHLAMDVSDLGSLLLGGATPSNLAAAGRITELVPGSLAVADAAFPWPTAPFCRTRF